MRELKDTDLYAEQAIVLGHAGHHEKALHLIIYKIGDHDMARQYCVDNTQATSRRGRQQLFLSLLKVYLHPSGDKRPFTAEAVHLLNSYQSDLNVVEVQLAVLLWLSTYSWHGIPLTRRPPSAPIGPATAARPLAAQLDPSFSQAIDAAGRALFGFDLG